MHNDWTIVMDTDVRHVWACEQDFRCHEIDRAAWSRTEVTPDFYEEAGTPVCGVCGEDMKYQYTKVRRN